MTEVETSKPDESTIASLFRVWTVLRKDLEPLLEPGSEVAEEIFLPKLEAAWSLEHLIAKTKPESLDDVRLKAVAVKHWLKDANTDQIVDDMLDSMMQVPA
jgi:hypothetical protein